MFVVRVGVALLAHPHLIGTAVRQAATLVPQKWWASGTRLPFPRDDYMKFRATTLSGNPNEEPSAHDVIVYLEWCRSMRALPSR